MGVSEVAAPGKRQPEMRFPVTPSATNLSAMCICGDLRCTVPYGHCHCYCGGIVPLAARNGPMGYPVKGQPVMFIQHHQKKRTIISNDPPFYLDGVPCRYIPLNRGYQAIVDEADYYEMAKHSWHVWVSKDKNHIYAFRYRFKDGKDGAISMHRELIGEPEGFEVDHQNGNGLDNRRSKNLRIATISQNRQNSRRHINNETGFRCVRRSGKRFRVNISVNNKRIDLGHYETAEEAHAAYCKAAREHHGEFARFD